MSEHAKKTVLYLVLSAAALATGSWVTLALVTVTFPLFVYNFGKVVENGR